MLVSVLLFLVGLLAVQQFQVLPSYLWLIMISLAAIIFASLRHWRLLFLVMGVWWAVVFAMLRLADQLPEAQEGSDIAVSGYVADLPEQDERRTRFDFIVQASAQKPAIQSIMKIQLHEAQPFYSGHTPPSPYVRVSVHCLSSRGFFV